MDTAAIVVAVIAGVLSLASGAYTTRIAARVEEQRRAKTKAEQVAELMSRYRDPLLRSAFDLQSRLYNIAQLGFLDAHYSCATPARKAYAVENTLFVLAEYLCWVEIMRREIRFMDLGDEPANREWAQCLDAVRRTLLSDRHDPVLQLFNGQQRAIGELMAVAPTAGGAERLDCRGYAAFVAKLDEPAFAGWFAQLRDDIEELARDPLGHSRLVALQRALVDLIDFLDPNHVRLPAGDLQKLAEP